MNETENSVGLQELQPTDRELIQAAGEARTHAHAPFSGYAVGAAVRTADGDVYRGCNIESSSYSLTICAERVALFGARASGASEVHALAVVGPLHRGGPTPPCGACRQVMYELAPDARILLATPQGSVRVCSVEDLLPWPFGPEHDETRR